MAADAADALLNLATPPRRASVAQTSTTPTKTLTIARLKRTSTDQHDITYKTPDGKTCEIPFFVNEDDTSFMCRRAKAARALYDPTRADVYCTWNGKVVNIPVTGARYLQFHDSPQQKRYMLKNVVQLVYCRFTCIQWGEDDDDTCRSCSNRGFRACCQKPRYLYFIMPLPAYKSYPMMCDNAVSELEPVVVPKDTKPWNNHTPQNYIR